MEGQNARAVPTIMQYRNGKTEIVWPESLKSSAPILPLPAGHPYAR
jgi:branched-chain amino acid transport system substrate-binding protein